MAMGGVEIVMVYYIVCGIQLQSRLLNQTGILSESHPPYDK